VLGDHVLVLGGRHPAARYNDVWILNISERGANDAARLVRVSLQPPHPPLLPHPARLIPAANGVWAKLNAQGEPMRARKTHAVARVGARLYVFGGHDGDKWLGDMHVLDLSESCRKRRGAASDQLQPPPPPRTLDAAPLLPCLSPPLTLALPRTPPQAAGVALMPALPATLPHGSPRAWSVEGRASPAAASLLLSQSPSPFPVPGWQATGGRFNGGGVVVGGGGGGGIAEVAELFTHVSPTSAEAGGPVGGGPIWRAAPRSIIAVVPHPAWSPAVCAEMLTSAAEGRSSAWPLLSNALHVPGLSAPSNVQGTDPGGRDHTMLPAGYATVTSEPPSGLPIVPEVGTDLLGWVGMSLMFGDASTPDVVKQRYPTSCVTPQTSMVARSLFTHGGRLGWYLMAPGTGCGEGAATSDVLPAANPHNNTTASAVLLEAAQAARAGQPGPSPSQPGATLSATATAAASAASAGGTGASGHNPLHSYLPYLRDVISGAVPPAAVTRGREGDGAGGAGSGHARRSRAGAPRGGDGASSVDGSRDGSAGFTSWRVDDQDMAAGSASRAMSPPPPAVRSGGSPGELTSAAAAAASAPGLRAVTLPGTLLSHGFADVALEVEGVAIPAHRCVLAARCGFFKGQCACGGGWGGVGAVCMRARLAHDDAHGVMHLRPVRSHVFLPGRRHCAIPCWW